MEKLLGIKCFIYNKEEKIRLKISADDKNVGYVYLPKHPKELVHGIVKETIPLDRLIDNYNSIPIYLDFDKDGELIGIEILG